VASKTRIVHYLNQFFGGIGGEERADTGPQAQDGPVGPGRAIRKIAEEWGEVVGTIICGDNYYAENRDRAINEIIKKISGYEPDMVIAGPAFNAGRYGVACGEICKNVQERLGIPAVTGMFEENPGVDLFREHVYIVKTDESVRGMSDALSRMVLIGMKLLRKDPLGPPNEEGYFARGIIKNVFTEKTAAARAVDMVLAKIKGVPFEPELDLPRFDRVRPARLRKDLASATIALATDGGLVPKGNPDRMESNRSTRFAVYSVAGIKSLSPQRFEANHMGFDTYLVNEDPNRLVPLDVARELEAEGVVGKIHDRIYSTAGVATSLRNAEAIARGMAESMRSDGIDGVILTST